MSVMEQGEDAFRIRTSPLIQIRALVRNAALYLYYVARQRLPEYGSSQRYEDFSLITLKDLFRMK